MESLDVNRVLIEPIDVNGVSWNITNVTKALSSPKYINLSKLYMEPSLPLNEKVNFSDLIWDFSENKKAHEEKTDYIYNFQSITTLSYRIFTKRFVLREIYNDNAFTSIARTLPEVKKFVHYLENEKYIFQPSLINENVMKDFIDNKCRHLKERTKTSAVFGSLRKFLMEVELEVDGFSISKFEKLFRVDKETLEAEIEAGKTPNIPRRLLNRIIQVALNEINDSRYDSYVTISELADELGVSYTTIAKRIEKGYYYGTVIAGGKKKKHLIPIEYMNNNTNVVNKGYMEKKIEEFQKNPPPTIEERMIACMILLLSQTGMRIGEFLLLEINRLNYTQILNGEKTAPYLEFFTYKTTPSKDGKWTETFMNDISLKAYNTLISLTEDRRKEGQKALYISSKGNHYSKNQISAHIKKFFFKHQDSLGFQLLNRDQLDALPKWVISESNFYNRFKSIQRNDIGRTIYKVNPHQFRVAVVNYLKNKGVSLQWIRKHMNHLEEDMTKHYFRDEKKVRTALINRASKDGSILETNPEKISDNKIKDELMEPEFQEAYKTINKFLAKKRLNIFRDLEEIIEILVDSPINETELGFCINAVGKICERQEKLATLERWYYLKPDIPDIAYFDFTYKRLLDKLKLVEHNQVAASKNSKYYRQLEIESKALEKFYNNKFLPELEKLKEELRKHGQDVINNKYPTLAHITSNLSNIETEVEKCLIKLKLVK